MNKYIFPGADASCSLGWVINQVEAAGFEVKQVDVLGVHYSATIYRWYQNWVSNKDKVIEKYGERYAPFSLHFTSTYTLILNENDNSVGTVSGSSSLRIRLLSPGKQFLVHPMYPRNHLLTLYSAKDPLPSSKSPSTRTSTHTTVSRASPATPPCTPPRLANSRTFLSTSLPRTDLKANEFHKTRLDLLCN